MNRYEQRLKDFENAFIKLKEGTQKENPDDLEIDGVLQRFEFTFELAWKTLKDYMEYQGFSNKIGSPREIIQQAFKHGLIEDGETWIKMMLSRNALSHLYDENTSRKIYEEIKKQYIELLEALIEKLKNRRK